MSSKLEATGKLRRLLNFSLGRWLAVLAALGVPPEHLTGKHGPCPFCGGKDRFRFDDKAGRGTWICNQCGAGDGVDFIRRLHDCDFVTACGHLARVVGMCEVERRAESDRDRRKDLRDLMRGATADLRETPVERYLRSRKLLRDGPDFGGIRDLYWHPACWEAETKRTMGAMLAVVRDVAGKAVSVHRTYLTHDGRKANLRSPRKMMPPIGTVRGCCVRLMATPADVVAVAEGIETALAVELLHGWPCWAALNAGGLESLELPKKLQTVQVCGDCDSSYTGQAAAYALAKRLKSEGRGVVVCLPDSFDCDYADVWLREASA